MKLRILAGTVLLGAVYFFVSHDSFHSSDELQSAATPFDITDIDSDISTPLNSPKLKSNTAAKTAQSIEEDAELNAEKSALKDCIDAEVSHAKWEREKERLLHQFLMDLHDEGAGIEQMVRLLSASGIDVQSTVLNLYVDPRDMHPELRASHHIRTNGQRVPLSQSKHIVDFAYTRNYDAIIAAVSRGDLVTNGVYMFYDLLTLIVSSNPQISELTLTQLLSAGIQPTVPALVVLTKQGRPDAVLQTVLNFGHDLDFKDHWGTDEYHQNLLTLALEQGKVSAAKFWWEQGVPSFLGRIDSTALDVFPTPNSDEAQALLVDITLRFAAEQRYPKSLVKLRQIKHWLPTDIQEELTDYFAAGFEQLNEINNSEFGQRLQQLLAELSAERAGLEAGESCQRQQDFRQYVVEREQDWQVEARKEEGSPLWLMREVNRVDAASLKRPDSKAKVSLRHLLISQENWSEIKERLDNGEALPSDAILILAARNQAQMIRDLQGYGLNFHAADAVGNNAWHRAVLAMSLYTDQTPYDVMDILIENDVDINVGRDIMIHTLDKRGNVSRISELLSYLENAGAIITNQQYQYVLHQFKGYAPNLPIITSWYEKRLN